MGLAGNDLANGFEIIVMFLPAASGRKEVRRTMRLEKNNKSIMQII